VAQEQGKADIFVPDNRNALSISTLLNTKMYISPTTRHALLSLCGLIVLLLLYKGVSTMRLLEQRTEALESEVEELRFLIAHSTPTVEVAPTNTIPTSPTVLPKEHRPLSAPDSSGHSARPVPTEEESKAPSPYGTTATYTTLPKFKKPVLIELNRADSALLVRIPGIGEKSAAALIRYRERLGGYVDLRQLCEAARWIEPQDLSKWENQWLTVNANEIRPLHLNSDDFRTLLRHPYLDYPQVKALFDLRDKKATISSWDEIVATGIFTDGDIARLRPYVQFD
jgi:hypothetical protein